MRDTNRVGCASLTIVAAIIFGVSTQAHAFSSGITTASFGAPGCNQCHSAGTAPTVTLTGPQVVAPSSTNEYTLAIATAFPQLHGGLNVSAPDGTLSVGGADSAQTQTLPGPTLLPEITHSSPKAAGAWDTVTFTFMWTAPSSFTSVTLTGWGNAVNFNNSPSGDQASKATLAISSTTADTPTPTATPSATPTPANACPANLSAKKPYLIATPAARSCQEGIAKAGFIYTKGRFKAVQKCLKKRQKGTLSGDPLVVCHGDLVGGVPVPPGDADTAESVAKAETKARAAIDDRCTDALIAALDTCGDAVADAKNCQIAEHWQLVEDAINAEYGNLVATTDKGAQRCQGGIGKAGSKYFSSKLKAIQKCLNKRNKMCGTGDAAALCMGAVVGGTVVPPTDASTANKFVKAEGKLRSLINSKCADLDVAALDACGSSRTTVGDCLVCSHRVATFGGIASEYGGADLFANPATTIQPIVDAANPNDTIMLDPGTYLESVTIPVDGLTFKGQKTCAGGRAVIENPGAVANGIFGSFKNNLTFEGFEVNNFDENDIFITNADGVTFRDMITRAPGTPTGTEYGIFPILSNNVLIENSLVTGVRDAGIYVGQSTNIVVRNNEVHDNVAGIEIENSANAEVYGNFAHDNSGGLLVFKLAGLSVQLSNCHNIHDNTSINNNGPNFGSGLVGLVPQGTGILVLSNDSSQFRNNVVTGNKTLGIAIVDQQTLNLLFDPDPFPVKSADYKVENNFFINNTFTGNAYDPDPGVPVAADTVWFTSGGAGNCQDGNTIDVDGGLLDRPSCTLPEPPGCPIP